jgi:hypothetical protein
MLVGILIDRVKGHFTYELREIMFYGFIVCKIMPNMQWDLLLIGRIIIYMCTSI